MNIRFAGSIPGLEEFMSGPNMGALSAGATDLRSREKSAGIGLQGQVAGAGLRAKGNAISGGLLGDARAAAGRSAMMGSIFQTLGQVGGAAISKFGDSGYAGTGAEKYGSMNTNSVDAAIKKYGGGYSDHHGGIWTGS